MNLIDNNKNLYLLSAIPAEEKECHLFDDMTNNTFQIASTHFSYHELIALTSRIEIS